LLDEVVYLEKQIAEILEYALMKLDVQRMKTALPLEVVTIVK